MITATVTGARPPSSSDSPIPIAVVIDFGSIVTYCSCVRPKATDKPSTLPRQATVPESIPPNTASGYFLRYDSFS